MAKILVVDDHPSIVRLLQRVLQTERHEVVTAADGEEALRKVREEQPALVILDVMMPRKNGFEVLRELRSNPESEQTIVIMLTARDLDVEMKHGLQLGADWYLPKPFSPTEVVSLTRRFLGDRSTE
jgi:two-component system alkaline phosphatase synthesis response regulator PhoP/two-component system response regulator VicR